MVDDEELLDLVEMEIRELLNELRLPGRRRSDHPRHRSGRSGVRVHRSECTGVRLHP